MIVLEVDVCYLNRVRLPVAQVLEIALYSIEVTGL
jgi:hypothetical protein